MNKEFIIYGSSKLLNGIVAILSVIIFTRLLDAESYGKYSIWITSVLIFSSLFYQWIALSVTRFNSAESNYPNIVSNEIYKLCILTLLLSIPIISFIYIAFGESREWLDLVLIILAVNLFGFINVICQLENSLQHSLKYAVIMFCKSFGVLLLSCILLSTTELGWKNIILGQVITLLLVVLIFKRNMRFESSKTVEIRQKIIAYGIPLSLSTISILIIDYFDRIMIAHWYGYSEVAGYAASYDITQQTIGALFNVLVLIYFPKLVDLHTTSNNQSYINKLSLYFKSNIFLGFLLLNLFLLGNQELSNLFFGKNISNDASIVMPYISVAIIIASLKVNMFDTILKLRGKTTTIVKISIFMAITNVVFNFILIPKLGAIGASISTLISFVSGFIISFYSVKNSLAPLRSLKLVNLVTKLLFVISIFFMIKESIFSYEEGIVQSLLTLLVLCFSCIGFLILFYKNEMLKCLK